jgi:hypothetical protein
MPEFTPADDLRDARTLFEFAKQQGGLGDDPKFVAIIIKAAMSAGGDEYLKIAESCGWTREALNDVRCRR